MLVSASVKTLAHSMKLQPSVAFAIDETLSRKKVGMLGPVELAPKIC